MEGTDREPATGGMTLASLLQLSHASIRGGAAHHYLKGAVVTGRGADTAKEAAFAWTGVRREETPGPGWYSIDGAWEYLKVRALVWG